MDFVNGAPFAARANRAALFCTYKRSFPPGKAFDDESSSMQSCTRTLDDAAHKVMKV